MMHSDNVQLWARITRETLPGVHLEAHPRGGGGGHLSELHPGEGLRVKASAGAGERGMKVKGERKRERSGSPPPHRQVSAIS